MNDIKYRIGIDLGGTRVKAGILNEDNEILCSKSCDTGVGRPFAVIVKDIVGLINELLNELDITVGDCRSIGIGSPGVVDKNKGTVVFSGNLKWTHEPLVGEIGKYFDLPIKISNDGNCAVLGEMLTGGAKGYENVILVTIGTGIGGGVVCDGEMQEGGHPGGMELGHTLLIMDGVECTCGRKGCLESYTTANALATQAEAAALENENSLLYDSYVKNNKVMNAEIPFEAAKTGCITARTVINTYIRYLGEGIISFVNVWRPDIVLLGGGVANAGSYLIEPLNEYIKPRCFAGDKAYVPPIKKAVLGNNAGIVGAANL